MKVLSKRNVVVLVLFLASIGFAQTTTIDSGNQLKLGLKAGLNLSNIYDKQNQEYVADNKAGVFGGVYLSIPLGKSIGFQPEILYSQKGFKGSGNVLGVDYDFSRTSNFIDIPLQIQIKPIEFVTILAGPQFSYLLDTKNEFNGSTDTVTEDNINSENYKKNILGFVLGADFNLSHFVITTRAGWDISSSDANGNDSTPRYKNRVLQLGLGYTF